MNIYPCFSLSTIRSTSLIAYRWVRCALLPSLMLLPVLLLSPQSFAGGGVRLGLSNQFISAGVYSLSGFDGEDIQRDTQRGFVHSELSMHFDSNSEGFVLDLFGEAGRFITEDQRLSIAIGVRPVVGQTKNKENDSEDEEKDYSIFEIMIGGRLEFTSWLSQDFKIKSSVFYYRAPNIVSFGDFDYTQFAGIRFGVPIIASSEIYAAYQNMSGQLDDDGFDDTVNMIEAFSIGVRLGL